MISRVAIPSLFVLGVEPGAGKTLIAGALADWFRRRGMRVAVCVPVQTGAVRRREGLVSEEAEFLAACANARHPLDLICPQRYAEGFIPAIAARRANRSLDWDAVNRSIRLMSRDSDVMIIQSPATLLTPLDERHTTLDLINELRTPVILVSRAGLERINAIALVARVLRDAPVKVAGVILNRYPADTPQLDEELGLREMERSTKLPLLCVVPEDRAIGTELLSAEVTGAIDLVDWLAVTNGVKAP